MDNITLRVVDGKGNEVFFKVRKDAPLEQLIVAYAQRQPSLPSDNLLFRNERTQDMVDPNLTSAQMNFQPMDTLTVV